jgi:hypothetical protein
MKIQSFFMENSLGREACTERLGLRLSMLVEVSPSSVTTYPELVSGSTALNENSEFFYGK